MKVLISKKYVFTIRLPPILWVTKPLGAFLTLEQTQQPLFVGTSVFANKTSIQRPEMDVSSGFPNKNGRFRFVSTCEAAEAAPFSCESGRSPSVGQVEKSIRLVFDASETFDVGMDLGSPVSLLYLGRIMAMFPR